MAKPIITYRGVVYPWHCDHIGHMNVMWYVGKFDEATWHMLAAVGLTPSYLRQQQRGMAAVQQNISYKRELRAGDIVSIRSGILEVKDKVIRFFHEMLNEETGETAAVTILTGVHMDAQARVACPFPEEIRARIKEMIVEYEGDSLDVQLKASAK
jgi:acyl-CoA thioester hydrolase